LDIAHFGSNIPAPLGVGSYAAGLTQPIFQGGALRNNLRYAKSQERQALITYQQTIQRAFGDVSDALIGYDKYQGVRERQEQTVKDLRESVDVSLMRYRGGTATYLDLLDRQRSLFQAELTLAQARNNEYQSLVQLYKAPGRVEAKRPASSHASSSSSWRGLPSGNSYPLVGVWRHRRANSLGTTGCGR
jgi:multidrug efflux system outer membrane protein